MRYTEKIGQAIEKAAVLHKDQVTKGDGKTPFIVHVVKVMVLVGEYTDDENTIIAAVLHDTIEDTNYTLDELEKDFGKQVREIVAGVTEDKLDKNGNKRPWLTRKKDYIKNLEKDSQESLLISAADKIANTESFIYEYKKVGKKLEDNFNASFKETHWYHDEVIKMLDKRLKSGIVDRLKAIQEEAKKVVV
jgi:(p)ppGpp synthase/HD superfamily hydrolase